MTRGFAFSDMQMPYQDDKAVTLAFKACKYWKPELIVNIGDLADQESCSRWNENDPTNQVLNALAPESKLVKNYWAKLRKQHPKARLAWTLGNHDIRWEQYVDKKAPALRELMSNETLWGTDTYGVEIYDYDRPPELKIGDNFYLHHGAAVSKHAAESVKADMDSWGCSLIRGHSHRMGVHYKTFELRDETLQGFEIGHLADVKSSGFKYSQIHNWQQGFIIWEEHEGQVFPQLIPVYSDGTNSWCYIGIKKIIA